MNAAQAAPIRAHSALERDIGMSNKHENFIRLSIKAAQRAREHGNEPFGAVLVKEGEVLLEAENSQNTDQDLTRHAELNLVSEAMRRFESDVLAQSILYSSTEPCAMCAGAIYWAGIPTVVYSCSAESWDNEASSGLLIPCREIFARGSRQVEVIGPILEEEGLMVYQDYW